MSSPLFIHSASALRWVVGLVLVTLSITSCTQRRVTTFAPDVAPAATSEDVTIVIDQVTRYQGGMEVCITINNRSKAAVSFSRMRSTFTTVQAFTDLGPVAGARREYGKQGNMGLDYVVASASTQILTLQFNGVGFESQSAQTIHVTAVSGSSHLMWDLIIPANPQEKSSAPTRSSQDLRMAPKSGRSYRRQ